MYTHAGVCFWLNHEEGQTLCIIEAMEGTGFRIMPLDAYLLDCRQRWCEVDWYQITDESVDRKTVGRTMLRLWRHQHPYPSVWELLSNFGILTPWVRQKLGLPPETRRQSFTCSEAVAYCLREAGFDFRETFTNLPARTPPGHIQRYTCLSYRGFLELDVEDAETTETGKLSQDTDMGLDIRRSK